MMSKTIFTLLMTPALVLSAQAADSSLTPDPQAVIKRIQKLSSRSSLTAPVGPLEQVRGFVDYPDHVVETVPAMELLRSHSLKYQPWSGHTWALRHGQIARRFGDKGFPTSDDWKLNYDYTHVFAPPGALVDQGRINALSAAEKYDLLIDPTRAFKFTEVNWEEGGKYFREKGVVEGWMGICHGTTAGGVMVKKPKKAVDVVAADGVTRIRFYPSDLKALASQFWAYIPTGQYRYAGLRCDLKKEEIQASTRATNPECFDTSAGAFHLSLVNNLGLFKQPVVMDRSAFNEVWNHTIYKYEYQYFNPKTKKVTSNYSEAMIRKEEYRNDPYAQYRHAATKYIVGVRNYSHYRISQPATSRDSAPETEASRQVEYVYDLELDENLKVVGGEWYKDNFPDFLWRPITKQNALADAEVNLTSTWDLNAPLPADWQSAAQTAVGQKIPLSKIVDALVRASRSGNTVGNGSGDGPVEHDPGMED